MSSRVAVALVSFTLLAVASCAREEGAEEIEARLRAARADSVALAEAQYDASAFDTLSWQNQEARLERGRVVWNHSCARCHGYDGEGNGELAQQMGVEVPSFLRAEWPLAGDVPAMRHAIYVGHESVMPNWGLQGLSYRDMDAAAAHIEQLTRSDQR